MLIFSSCIANPFMSDAFTPMQHDICVCISYIKVCLPCFMNYLWTKLFPEAQNQVCMTNIWQRLRLCGNVCVVSGGWWLSASCLDMTAARPPKPAALCLNSVPFVVCFKGSTESMKLGCVACVQMVLVSRVVSECCSSAGCSSGRFCCSCCWWLKLSALNNKRMKFSNTQTRSDPGWIHPCL